MNLAIGSDHNGHQLKQLMIPYLQAQGYTVEDVGNSHYDAGDDFPQYAQAVARAVQAGGGAVRGILLCGSGQGMCMAANRFLGVRASLVWDVASAQHTRRDNDSNVLCLPADILHGEPQQWQRIIDAWLKTAFADEVRFRRRNQQIDEVVA